jgi:STE24 endopeptidase
LTWTARIPAVALAAAAWLACAWLLLDTAVPEGLATPPLDVAAVFGRDVVRQAEHVERLFRASWAVQQVVLLVTLWVYAKRGPGFSRESAAGPIGTGVLLGMLGLGVVWLVQLPFGLLDFWWARRYDLTRTGYLEWAFGDWLTLGAAFAAISLALVIVMFLARRLGEWWWLPGAAVFVAIAMLFTFTAPYLVTGTTQLESPTLRASAADFERLQGVSGVPVSVEDVSGETSQANAYAIGLGPSRKIVLWSTLLDGRFSDGAVQVVLAHEIAHHSSDHLWKGIGWFALFALPGAWALMRLTRRRGGMGAPAAVPLALLIVTVIQLVLLPAQNWISRRMESEADWKALQTTRDPGAARGLFVGFGRTSLGDPDPPAWAHVLLDTHPSLAQRVAMAEAWRQAQSS